MCGSKWTKLALALVWHLAQVCTRFSGESVDLGSSKGRMSCEPWQSAHLAAGP